MNAYDVHYENMIVPANAPVELMFLDSGGYEALKDSQVMDPFYPLPPPQVWNNDLYLNILRGIDPQLVMPIIVTSFDHPSERQPISEQIDNALNTFKLFPHFGRELLLKPDSHTDHFINIEQLLASVQRFRDFDIIGTTETELGGSIYERMSNIVRVRTAMHMFNIEIPLHIYGSLDPVCTPLYFLAGADIFDGLSWLRFAYKDDLAVYHSNRSPLEYGVKLDDGRALLRNYAANLHYLTELTERMQRYLVEREETTLGRHGKFFAQCVVDLRAEHGGII